MAVQRPETLTDPKTTIPFIDLSYDTQDQESVLKLIYQIRPSWKKDRAELEIVKFTDGITNTVSLTTEHVLI